MSLPVVPHPKDGISEHDDVSDLTRLHTPDARSQEPKTKDESTSNSTFTSQSEKRDPEASLSSSNEEELYSFPDGGLKAWLVVAGVRSSLQPFSPVKLIRLNVHPVFLWNAVNVGSIRVARLSSLFTFHLRLKLWIRECVGCK